ncbi:YbaN family protein [Roseibium sp.]|uniref:YbaN family protein n=1 Tax=Roseibium sp. TaxID=1936156 RepID=UPI003B51849F
MPKSEARVHRSTFILLGLACVAVGIIGAFLPILPSTIFFIAAAACFARSSPRLEQKILEHPIVGPSVVAWRHHGAIPPMAKFYAVGGMTLGFAVFYWSAAPAPWLAVLVALGITACAIYVVTRPSGPKSASDKAGDPGTNSAPSDVGN